MRAPFHTHAPGRKLTTAAFGLALVLSALYGGAAARAQAQDAAPQAQAPPQGRPAREGALVRRLNLTDEQRSRLGEIRREAETAGRELARRMRLARRALDVAIYADAADEALVEQRAREFSAAQAALVSHRAATELKVRRVLTDVQLRAFRRLRQQAARRQQMQRRLNNSRRRPPADAPPPARPGDDPAEEPAAEPAAEPPATRGQRP